MKLWPGLRVQLILLISISLIRLGGAYAAVDHTLYASKIFKWFKDDFNKDIIGFFLKYSEGSLRKDLAANRDKIKIKFLDYDWSLNGF